MRLLLTWPVGRCVVDTNLRRSGTERLSRPGPLHVPWGPGPHGCTKNSRLRGARCGPLATRADEGEGTSPGKPGAASKSRGAASKSLCGSPLLLAALGGLSCQLSTRQPRQAACRPERRGCRARWPQPSSTSGTAVALVVEPVNTAGWRAVASTGATWPRCAGQIHQLRRPLACPCCTSRAYLVGLSVDVGANGEGCVARAARSSRPARVDRPSS